MQQALLPKSCIELILLAWLKLVGSLLRVVGKYICGLLLVLRAECIGIVIVVVIDVRLVVVECVGLAIVIVKYIGFFEICI